MAKKSSGYIGRNNCKWPIVVVHLVYQGKSNIHLTNQNKQEMKIKAILFLTLFFLIIHVSSKDSLPLSGSRSNGGWEVIVRMDSSVTDLEAIQICLIESDPYVSYKKNFFTTSYSELLRQAKNEDHKTRIFIGHIDYTWDKVLDQVKGSHMLLVTRTLSPIQSYSSDTGFPKKKMWVISSVFYLEKIPYCYIIPIEVGYGTKLDIVLSNSNRTLMTDLTEL